MPSTLFRQAALAHKSQPMQGRLLLAASPKTTVLTVIAFGFSVCIVVFLAVGEFNRKASVQGYLAPDKGLIKVYPPTTGTVIEQRVVEGHKVVKGQILAVISTERRSLDVRDAHAEALRLLNARESSLNAELLVLSKQEDLRSAAIEVNQSNLEDELRQLDIVIDTFRSRLKNALSSAQRIAELSQSGFVAKEQLHREQDRTLDLRGQLQIMERDRVALSGRLQVLRTESENLSLSMQGQREALNRQVLQIRQQRADYQSNNHVVVAAPVSGTVSTVLINTGQQSRHGAPLLSIIPEGAELEAQLLVPSHAIGFITPGQRVALRYAAFPYQRFGHHQGVVQSIARNLLLPGDADLPMPLESPAYRVTVNLNDQSVSAYQQEFPLQSGMSVSGDVLLDRRSIFQWIFDPLLSMTQSMTVGS